MVLCLKYSRRQHRAVARPSTTRFQGKPSARWSANFAKKLETKNWQKSARREAHSLWCITGCPKKRVIQKKGWPDRGMEPCLELAEQSHFKLTRRERPVGFANETDRSFCEFQTCLHPPV
ncbi:hypothetical protein L596_021382 [Steinernema carpocapsae]|uniref:Uncharacterized protein n=1 Tax=Steinernema carpocapsae TaxID=34508 RepID=A0A4U5MIL7_STECR|nr:hypothetical protein L596_021382 [Steinernema carpocapsae]